AGRVRGEDAHVGRVRQPARGGDAGQARPAQAARPALGRGAPGAARRDPHRPGRRPAPAARAGRGRARPRAGRMALGTAHTVALQGALGHLIDVQADISPGTPGTTLVGRPDPTLHEARDRCRMAVSNSGVPWPATRRVTILLAPSDLVKRGTHFDLAIA